MLGSLLDLLKNNPANNTFFFRYLVYEEKKTFFPVIETQSVSTLNFNLLINKIKV